MLETLEFKFVRNPLWPFKSTLKVSDKGIENKGKLIEWTEIEDFNYGISLINNATNYSFFFTDKAGKRNHINFIVPVIGGKKKKQLLGTAFQCLAYGFQEKVTVPKAIELIAALKSGGKAELAKCKLNQTGIEIKVGAIKKEPCFIPWESVNLTNSNQGGFIISSSQNKKKRMGFVYHLALGCRILESVAHGMTMGRLK